MSMDVCLQREAKEQFAHFTETIHVDDKLMDQLIDYVGVTQIKGYRVQNGKVELDRKFGNKWIQGLKDRGKIEFLRPDDLRPDIVLRMLQEACDWYKNQNGKIIPNTYLFVLISDNHPWKIESHPFYSIVSQIPIFCFSRPRNDRHYPLLPETTFYHFNFEEKFDSNIQSNSSWDVQKQYLLKNTIPPGSESWDQKCIFFKGSLSGQRHCNLRWHLLRNKMPLSIPMNIQVSTKDNFESIDKWNRFKFLVSLPGHMPWSNRLKYLLLLPDPLVIDVQVVTRKFKMTQDHTTVLDYEDAPYETFLELCLGIQSASETPWARVKYLYEKVDNTEVKTQERVGQLIRDIQNICLNQSHHYRKKQAEVRKRLLQLSDMHIHQYVADCMVQNSRILV